MLLSFSLMIRYAFGTGKEDCEREVELNSWLAENTYLRVISLCLNGQ